MTSIGECRHALISSTLIHGQMGGGGQPLMDQKKSIPSQTILDPAIRQRKRTLRFFRLKAKKIHFQVKMNLKNTIFEHFCQKHSEKLTIQFLPHLCDKKGHFFL